MTRQVRQARQAYKRECGLLSKARKAGLSKVTIHNQEKTIKNMQLSKLLLQA